MSAEGLEDYSKNDLIEELINRQTFCGVVIFHRGDAKAGRLEPGETVVTKSPPLTREVVEQLLETGRALVPVMFGDVAADEAGRPSDAIPLSLEDSALRLDDGGVVRIGMSRVSLDLVVEEYESGRTPDDIVHAYDTLNLADVYAAIAYYLRHRDDVRAYLLRRKEEAKALRTRVEADRPPVSREELLARRRAGQEEHAPTRH